jgi:hypothetical protein
MTKTGGGKGAPRPRGGSITNALSDTGARSAKALPATSTPGWYPMRMRPYNLDGHRGCGRSDPLTPRGAWYLNENGILAKMTLP